MVLGLLLRRPGGRDEKYLAGRTLSTSAVAATLAATSIGGSATVALAGFVYTRGLSGLWLDLPLAAGLVATGILLAGPVRASGAMSLPQLSQSHYGEGFRRALAVLVLCAEVAWFALLTRAAAPFLQQMTGLDPTAALLTVAGLFTLYTALGGQRAVAATDSLQLWLLMVAGLAVPALLVLGRTDLLAGLEPSMVQFPMGAGMDLRAIAGLFMMMSLPGMVGGDVYGKILSARNAKSARRGTVAAGLIKVAAAACVAVLALGARLALTAEHHPDEVLSAVLAEVMPAWLLPLAWLGFLAAMMSSADSVLLTGATVLDVDLLPQPSRRPSWFSPAFVVACLAALGTLIALAASGVVPLLMWAYTVFAAGAPLPILAALILRRRASGSWATAALALGGAVAAAAKLAGMESAVLYGLAASAILMGLGLALGESSAFRECSQQVS